MATLNAAVCEDRIKWDHDCEQAMAELRERMRNLPRKMYDPLDLLDDDRCLVMMGDAAETGIDAGLFLVNRGNADDVVPEDMLADTTILMDLYHKVLDSDQRRWQVFELEAYAMYCSTQKWGKYVSRALAKRDKWPCNKIAMLTDSTTAAVKWFNVHMPEYDLDHLCAKGKRFLHWGDKIAYSATWPMCTKHLPGELNCLAHMLSHVGDILTAMGKHGDGKLTPAQASEILQSESEDKGYLAYLEKAADEVSSGVYAMEAMRVISAKVMSLFTYTASQHTMEVVVHATALQSYHGQHEDKLSQHTVQVAVNATSMHTYHGQRAVVCDDK